MTTKNQILDAPALGWKFTVVKTSADTDGKSLDLTWELFPQCNMNMKEPWVHMHPNAIETYEILEGEMEFFVKDKWIPAKKGDQLTVEKGVAHTFRNPTDKTVKVYNTHEPALKMENYFEDVCKTVDKVTDNGKKAFKPNLNAMIYFSMLMKRYKNEIIAKGTPPIAINLLGFIGKLQGRKL